VNIGRLATASALGEPSSEHAVFNIQTIFFYFLGGYKMRIDISSSN